jgi:hypothetical protein
LAVPEVPAVVSVTVITAVHAVPGAADAGYWCVVERSYWFVVVNAAFGQDLKKQIDRDFVDHECVKS